MLFLGSEVSFHSYDDSLASFYRRQYGFATAVLRWYAEIHRRLVSMLSLTVGQ